MSAVFRALLVVAVAMLISLAAAQTPPPAAPPKPQRVQPPARISEFRAQPASIQPGQSATLIWATENPNGITVSPEVGRVTPRGSRQVTPKATTTYTLTVAGPNNTVLTREVTVTVAGTAPVTASAATAPVAEPKKDTPRLANGKPDLSGVYSFGGGGAGAGRSAAPPAGGRSAAPAGPELKPGMEKYRVVRGPNDAGPLSDCMPIAGPAAFTVPYQFQILQTPAYAIILHEYPGIFRIIPTNGAAHPVDPDPTWLGDSVGRWEGDTLVVDTVGFNTRTELSGYKHSEALHIVERFSRPDFETLQYDATLEDPNVFVRPWTVSRTFPLRPDLNKIDEFVCENNKDYSKLFVKQ
ncbi:MAG: hypothetical protein JWO19_631 [Bryobacterales bacterium]|nr:hypothetical protein [Bryobacterales bacterium]